MTAAADQPTGAPLPGWTPPPAPGRRVMAGRLVRLEPLTADHAAALHAANTAAPNWTYLPYGPYATPAAYEEWVSEVSRHADPLFFAVIDPAEGPLGVASYLRITPASGSIEVGHINFSPRLQGRPGATEAIFLMMAWAFDAGYRRYEWKCDALNAPSRRAAQRLGLSYEGIFRQATVVKGRNRDTAWYAAIDAEWPALKAAFETWLDPANFDADGRQRRRLSDLTRPLLAATG
ncbi:MAG: GNAT family protein [Thermohalobaculum sp.]|nr:GNAT family protein [Thermohalobaculum sp.]